MILWNLNINIITMVYKAHDNALHTTEDTSPQFQLILMRLLSIHERIYSPISYRVQSYKKSDTYTSFMLKSRCF